MSRQEQWILLQERISDEDARWLRETYRQLANAQQTLRDVERDVADHQKDLIEKYLSEEERS